MICFISNKLNYSLQCSGRRLSAFFLILGFILIPILIPRVDVALANSEPKKNAATVETAQSETLASSDSQEYEQMLFDLYLADTMRGRILVEYTEKSFRIPSPQDLLEQLPAIKDSSKALELISGTIPGVRTINGVGTISYNLQTFQITVIFVPELMFSKELKASDLLPSPEADLSWQQTLRLDTSGTAQENLNGAFGLRTLAGYKKSWINADAALINTEGSDYEISSLSGSTIAQDVKIDSGLLRTDGQFLASGVEIAGFGIRTSQDVFLNNELLLSAAT